MPETRNMTTEIEQLRATLADLEKQVKGGQHHLPDPIKYLSEFSGNKRELNAWLKEVGEIFDAFKIKGENNSPDTMSSFHVRAIKNKIKGEARTTLCANGDPDTIPGIKRVMLEHYGDKRDFPTNLSLLFHIRRADKSYAKFFNEIKELNTKLKGNLLTNPLSAKDIIELLTVTKYLDNVAEPLASIIRNSAPKTLEDAHQAVIINQNAETRSKPKPNFIKKFDKPFEKGPKAGPSWNKNPAGKLFIKKSHVENNTNEQLAVESADEADDDVPDVTTDVSTDDDENCEVNFQRVRKMKKKT